MTNRTRTFSPKAKSMLAKAIASEALTWGEQNPIILTPEQWKAALIKCRMAMIRHYVKGQAI